jgi:hypothetical protein
MSRLCQKKKPEASAGSIHGIKQGTSIYTFLAWSALPPSSRTRRRLRRGSAISLSATSAQLAQRISELRRATAICNRRTARGSMERNIRVFDRRGIASSGSHSSLTRGLGTDQVRPVSRIFRINH